MKRAIKSAGSAKARAGIIRHLVVTTLPGRVNAGRLQAGALAIPCALGRNGVTRFKREGDGKTPFGRFALTGGYWRQDRLPAPGALLPLRPIRPQMGWCDDVDDANYNRPLRLPTRAGHEALMRSDGLYDVVLTLDHNQRPRMRGLGSAIFFHLKRSDNDPTAGCVAISRADMLRLLPRLSRDCIMVIR